MKEKEIKDKIKVLWEEFEEKIKPLEQELSLLKSKEHEGIKKFYQN